eukprot:CAMPEP_0170074696 /NCGR_PEP_ID=MMETSP0019_2-20121128/11956_1 /TAXON_ID=98059 /ORGANISM="Dinobryon sp., Strain UTEXLB2267" /LENGTH=488 /DNA_ID=CAMNT_0010285169 /DNA_START=282 /DNA_END=1748 /DNA_ORIENTATION=-
MPAIFLSPIAYFSIAFRSSVWFPLLQTSIAHSGAAFIKWGQWASSRPDIFSEKLCEQLAFLQSDAPTHAYSYTKQRVAAELGLSIEDAFASFEKEPIASGSIAQVYRAELRLPRSFCDDPKSLATCLPIPRPEPKHATHQPASTTSTLPVAVKVRHPNVEQHIKLDFYIMRWLADLVDRVPGLGWLHLGESMSQFSSVIARQTDLTEEGRHLQRFNSHFSSPQWQDIGFPVPLVLSQSVLVESFVAGVSVKQVVSDPRRSVRHAHFIVTRGEDLYFKMLIHDNFMHADLHPGNILFDRHRMALALVDAGMVTQPSADERHNVIGLLEALGEGLGGEAADCILRFSQSRHSQKQRRAFRGDMERLFAAVCRGYHHHVSVAEVLTGVLQLVQQHEVSIGANYATLLMNLICLDGMAQQLLPTYNVLDGAKVPLRLHRLISGVTRFLHLPRGFSQQWVQAVFPLVMRWKQRMDKKFLQKLMRTITAKGDNL